MSDFNPETEAKGLLRTYGDRAKQIVLDRMLQAIREFDMAAARLWERVAVIIDQYLKHGWSDEPQAAVRI